MAVKRYNFSPLRLTENTLTAENINRIQDAIANALRGISNAVPEASVSIGSSSGTWVEEIPSGTVNGSNTIFTLSNTPVDDSYTITVNGLVRTKTTDFSISGSTLTFTWAPATGSSIFAIYQK